MALLGLAQRVRPGSCNRLIVATPASLLLGGGMSRALVPRVLQSSKALTLPRRAAFYSSTSVKQHSETGGSGGEGRLFPEELNIIYDSKCNVCNLEIEFLRRRDVRLAQKRRQNDNGQTTTRLKFTDLESGNYDPNDPANGGVTYATGMASMHAVTANGKVVSGVPVFAMAYQQVNLGWLFSVTKIPGIKAIADWAYSMFAKCRTTVTRGKSLDTLIEVYREKQNWEQLKDQEAIDCDACNTKVSGTRKSQ